MVYINMFIKRTCIEYFIQRNIRGNRYKIIRKIKTNDVLYYSVELNIILMY